MKVSRLFRTLAEQLGLKVDNVVVLHEDLLVLAERADNRPKAADGQSTTLE